MKFFYHTIIISLSLIIFSSIFVFDLKGKTNDCGVPFDSFAWRKSQLADFEYSDSTDGRISEKICIHFCDTFNHKKIQSFYISLSNVELSDGIQVNNSDSVVIEKKNLPYFRPGDYSLQGQYKVDGYKCCNYLRIPSNVTKMVYFLFPKPNTIQFHIEDRLSIMDSVSFVINKSRLHRISDETYNKYCYDRPSVCSLTVYKEEFKTIDEVPYIEISHDIYIDEMLSFVVCVFNKNGQIEYYEYKFDYQPNVNSIIRICN